MFHFGELFWTLESSKFVLWNFLQYCMTWTILHLFKRLKQTNKQTPKSHTCEVVKYYLKCTERVPLWRRQKSYISHWVVLELFITNDIPKKSHDFLCSRNILLDPHVGFVCVFSQTTNSWLITEKQPQKK